MLTAISMSAIATNGVVPGNVGWLHNYIVSVNIDHHLWPKPFLRLTQLKYYNFVVGNDFTSVSAFSCLMLLLKNTCNID